MNNDERQRLNVRAIRVTLASALRHAGPDQTDRCVDRARQLLDHARSQATHPSVLADIDALDAELAGTDATAHQLDG